MDLTITPSKLNGVLNVIPSKSCLHRAIIAASLSKGKSIISNILESKDVLATIDCCKSMGADIKFINNELHVIGTNGSISNNATLYCNESGSTLRFMIPIMLTSNTNTTYSLKSSLASRPLDIYFNIFKEHNIKYSASPLNIEGQLTSGLYEIEGNVSSQFLTGLLYSLPLLDGDSVIKVNNLESIGYIDLTLDILRKYNINIINNNYKEFIVKGNQQYKCYNYKAEADYSQAAFFLVANELGSNIELLNLNSNSYQPDKKIITDIKDIKENKNISLKNNPDCGPILSVLASLYNVTFNHCSRLRIKECDRVDAITTTLNSLGCNIENTNDKIMFYKVDTFEGNVEVDCYNDHRIAMMLAIASTICRYPIKLLNATCVEKSYPNFWEDFKFLGGIINVE